MPERLPAATLTLVRRILEHLAVIGETLALRWSDGRETYLPLPAVRRACPCATCGGEPDVLGRVEHPEVSLNHASVQLRGYDFVGGYGWQPTWEDGHNTGIYSYSYLDRLENALEPTGGQP